KFEKLKFLSVKRFPPGTGEVNRYSLNDDVIRKAIQKKAYKFDSGLIKLIEQIESGKGNKKFLDFLARQKLIDSTGNIDFSGLASCGTTLTEIVQAMKSDTSGMDSQNL